MRIKILTLLAGLFLFSNLTFAQSVGEYRVRKTETVTRKIEKPKKPKVVRENNPERRGFYVTPEGGVGLNSYGKSILSISFHGKLGYEFNNHFALGIGTGVNLVTLSMPLYVCVHGDIGFFSKIAPYYSADFGYNFSDIRRTHGPLIAPEVGIRINKFHAGIEFTLYIDDIDILDNSCSLLFKFGYKIPLKKK